MSWYRLDLRAGLDDVTDRAWREVWRVAYDDGTYDPAKALFRSAGRSGTHTLYFSPSAYELAKTFGAVPCKKPSGEKLVFVVGSSEACTIHFTRAQISRPAPLAADDPSSFTSTLTSSAFPTTTPP